MQYQQVFRSWKEIGKRLHDFRMQGGRDLKMFQEKVGPLYQTNDIFDIYMNIRTNYPDNSVHEDTNNYRSYQRWLLNAKDVQKNSSEPGFYLLKWPSHAKTQWHNHPSKGCMMWHLDGFLLEERWMEGMSIWNAKMGRITRPKYIGGIDAIHRIGNPHPYQDAWSLHLYWPSTDANVWGIDNASK